VVAEIADRAVVMYKGEIVEQNSVKEIFSNPSILIQRPYWLADQLIMFVENGCRW
jgi:ABC-type dipeptide/oligopeptide/nickel transport system ATPase component